MRKQSFIFVDSPSQTSKQTDENDCLQNGSNEGSKLKLSFLAQKVENSF